MIIKEVIKRLGFIEDVDRSYFTEIFKDDTCLKEVHIEVYSENPVNASPLLMLVLRTSEENVLVSNDGNRLILKKSDKNKTYINNILLSKLTECYIKLSDDYSDIILNVRDIYYKISIFNGSYN